MNIPYIKEYVLLAFVRKKSYVKFLKFTGWLSFDGRAIEAGMTALCISFY